MVTKFSRYVGNSSHIFPAMNVKGMKNSRYNG
jgi:hypothetical protein